MRGRVTYRRYRNLKLKNNGFYPTFQWSKKTQQSHNEKVTTKVCVVFDSVVKHEGKSLSNAIWLGPKLQRDLVDVLTPFWQAPVALTADISEMLLQVELHDKDCPYHRFLWHDFDTSREPETYEFQYLLFVPKPGVQSIGEIQRMNE